MMKKTNAEVLDQLNTNVEKGLTSEEVNRRLAQHGRNEFQQTKPPSLLSLIWDQINSLLIYILIAAAIISAIVGEISDAIIIFLVILLNSIIGVVQESKAEQALQELKKMSTPQAVVKRDGVVQEISSEDIVIGDVVLLDSGRFVPADVRLFETANLTVEESSLTGESTAVEKDANWYSEEDVPLGDQKNKVFMSTLVTYGRGKGIVTHTGMDTEIGKIAKMLDRHEKEMTPLQQKLAELGKILGIGAIGISIIIFLIGYFQGRVILDMFLIAVSLAVAAIPEGLPAIVTIVLALGVRRMIKQHAIIRKLPAVETLGAVSVICSDKTGTLTENKMTVIDTFINDETIPTEQLSISDDTVNIFTKAMILCNDATIEGEKRAGDPTEIALIEAAQKIGLQKRDVEEQYPRIFEIPFDSDRKMMSTVHKKGNKRFLFVKGAIESILPKVTSIEKNGKTIPFSQEERSKIDQQVNEMSERAFRVLAIAYKQIQPEEKLNDQLESDLVFLGLTGMIDPPREEVKASIEQCKQAGIRVVMITGDHQKTALAIAKDLHIATEEDETMTGQELNTISDHKLQEKVDSIRVFARVSPEHKVRIVKALKANNQIVSMTGDGVNDAPSLKEADVGVAMGITGTDVAKGAADVVLTDDNFATITAAVEEGRNIYKNIKKSIIFLLSCNLGEILTLLIGILMGWPAPLTAVHILWVNLVTDTLPAISLGVDPEDPDVMTEKPREAKEKIFSKDDVIFSLWNGSLIAFLTLFAFVEGLKVYSGSESLFSMNIYQVPNEAVVHAQTMAFITLSVSQLFHSFNLRSKRKSIFKVGLFTNKLLLWSVIVGIAIQTIIVHTPFFQDVFRIQPLLIKDWIFVIGLSILPVVLNELVKAVKRLFAYNESRLKKS